MPDSLERYASPVTDAELTGDESHGSREQETDRADGDDAGSDIGAAAEVGPVDLVDGEVPTVSGNSDIFIPHKLVNLVNNNNNNLFRVSVKLNDTIVQAVIDSGSVYSLISQELANKLSLNVNPIETQLRVLGDHSFKTLGNSKCSFAIDNVEMQDLDLRIFPSSCALSSDLFLGIDFLKNNGIELCIGDRIIVKHLEDNGRVEIHLDNSGAPGRVLYCNINCYAAQDVEVARGTTQCVPINYCIPQGQANQMFLYADDSIDRKLAERVKGLMGITSFDTRKVLLVAGDEPSKVCKGQVIGKMSSVVELPYGEDDDGSNCVEIDDSDPISHIKLPGLSTLEQTEVFSMLSNVETVFGRGDGDVGHANVTEHVIRLSNDTPIYQRPRRFSPPMANEIERQCQELKTLDVIEASVSPWNSPIVPILKKGGGLRMCLDYRKLNQVTVPDRHPVPNLADSIFGLQGTKFFTRLDLVKSYYQIPIDESSRQCTAFSTPRNHWQFKRLSFGLRNAPSAFQREIQAVLSGFPSNKVIAYIDDILIMGSSFAEHLELVRKVLHTLNNYKLKIKPSKCEFFKAEVEFLGHIVSQNGIKKTPEYVDKVRNYPRPTTKGELREFLGFVNFQRKFLPNCSVIQRPLSCHTSGKKNKKLDWTAEMNEAFETLKKEMQREIELAYPDYSEGAERLELWVDASNLGAGAYLAQAQDKSHRVIGCGSMMFTGPQLNYSTLERELCALRWGIKTFRPFLYGVPFVLYTDHQPLVYLHNMKIVCSRLARTVEELADFIFDIFYVPGSLNTAADALSRINFNPVEYETLGDMSLPDGLIINGNCVPGGGDSMFVSLHRCLSRLARSKPVLGAEQELREQLVDELLINPTKYSIKLDRAGRKKLRLMRHKGQLPAFDILMAASRIYSVKIHVYFWAKTPVIYQFENYDQVIHLQCVSGIHFNPLIELGEYCPPDEKMCSVNTVQSPGIYRSLVRDNSVEVELGDSDTSIDLSFSCDTINVCTHAGCQLPQIKVKFGDLDLCAILDTGAEISLISVAAIDDIKRGMPVNVTKERICEIVGFSGHRKVIEQTVELTFSIGLYRMQKSHKFAIVDTDSFPYCLLLGLDFMTKYGLRLDLKNNLCRQSGGSVCPLVIDSLAGAAANVFTVRSLPSASHILKMENCNGDFRFEIEGTSPTIMGLSLVNDDHVTRLIQSQCPQLKNLSKVVANNTNVKKWPAKIRQFAKHRSNLSINDGILIFSSPTPVVVVPFKFLVGIVLVLHNEFAHVGRDKLLGLVNNLFWHPSTYKICNDVSTTCEKCQIVKEYATTVSPPTFKIKSTYPFELMAADLISFPKTSQGFVGCLMVVDHFSKWVATVPIKDKKSSTIIRMFTYQVLPFIPRLPTNLLTDNGPEFTSNEFESFARGFSIKHKLTTPYQPTSNGAVERVNKNIKNLIRSLSDSGLAWEESLPRAVITYNNTVHVELGVSPADFLINKPHSSEHTLFPESVKETWKVGHPNFIPFKVGQLVLAKVHMKGFLTTNKFQSNFTGPYEVIKVNDNGVTYQVKDLESAGISRAHHSKLRVYRPPPGYISSHPYYSHYNVTSAGAGRIDDAPSCSVELCFSDESDILPDSASRVEVFSDDSSDFSGFTSMDSSLVERTRQLKAVSKSLIINEPFQYNVTSSPCRGCCFETTKELEMSMVINESVDQIEPEAVSEVIPRESVVGSIGVRSCRLSSTASCVNLFDWSNSDLLSILSSDDGDFEIPSINSFGMVDESQERLSQSGSIATSEMSNSSVSGTLLTQLDPNIVTEPMDVIEIGGRAVTRENNEFEGFNPETLSYTRSANINKILSELPVNNSLAADLGSNESVHRQLRSKGPVPDQPRVQELILERVKKKRKTKCYDTA
jgi:hypothetical protein